MEIGGKKNLKKMKKNLIYTETPISFGWMTNKRGPKKGTKYSVPRRTQISWRVEDSLLRELEQTAQSAGIPKTRLIERAVVEYLSKLSKDDLLDHGQPS